MAHLRLRGLSGSICSCRTAGHANIIEGGGLGVVGMACNFPGKAEAGNIGSLGGEIPQKESKTWPLKAKTPGKIGQTQRDVKSYWNVKFLGPLWGELVMIIRIFVVQNAEWCAKWFFLTVNI